MLVVATSHPKVPLEKLDSVDIDEAGRVGVKVGAAFELLVGKQVKLPCPSFLSRDIFLKQIFLVEDVDYVVVISAGLDQDNEVAVGTEVHVRSGFQWVKNILCFLCISNLKKIIKQDKGWWSYCSSLVLNIASV